MSVLLTWFDSEVDPCGVYGITLEWYQTTRELSETPLPELIQNMAGRLEFKEIKKYGKFIDWD